MRAAHILSVVLGAALLAGCPKVPISDIEARFELAEAAWFEEEETLFYFFELGAEQGLSEDSRVEVRYQTDDGELTWTATQALDLVHTHVSVECGYKRRCGSLSLHVPLQPRNVSIRLRYHQDGEVFLDSETAYNVIGRGPAHINRSFLVYGVFTEDNRRIQWRGRHRFPTLRNQAVQELGLRRAFRVDTQRYGTSVPSLVENPYAYGTSCFADFVDAEIPAVSTEDRAVFNAIDLPIAAASQPIVCARALVHEAKETFITSAVARKNPEVAPAFPILRSPVHEATPLKFYLAPCNRVISEEHDEMQRQRMLYGDGPARCTDNWRNPDFVDQLVLEFRAAIEAARPDGEDMIIVVGLHRDEVEVADLLEEALAQVLPPERARSTPRVVGGFVFDSDIRDVKDNALSRLVLWCPARLIDPEGDPEDRPDDGPPSDPSRENCAIMADNINLNLGPFSLTSLPILPSRSRYLDFIDDYSASQAGKVKTITFLAPEFTPTTDNSEVDGAVATFFNAEIISAKPEDAFSFCETDQFQSFVFRSMLTGAEELKCSQQAPGDDGFCLPDNQDFLPIQVLPEWHHIVKETTYEVGLLWDFPWLLRATYEVVAAASAGAFGLSVPFGFANDTTESFGTEIWRFGEFSLKEILTQCHRFCDHPTFDSAGIFNVTKSFRETYRSNCYLPNYPVVGDSSFPRDP